MACTQKGARAGIAIGSMPRVALTWVAMLAATLFAEPAQAQTSDAAPLKIGFSSFAPFSYIDQNGDQTGFLVELAQELGLELGVPIVVEDYEDARAFIAAQASGQTHMIAGVARLPALEPSNVFSAPVASETLRLIVRTDDQDRRLGVPLEGQRIGIVPPAAGSQVSALLQQNERIEFASPQGAIFALLSHEVDALLLPNPVALSIAHNAGLDQRIAFVGAPLQTFDRYVALHRDRADLLPAVDAALANMRADGRLQALQSKYLITLPKPAPDVLRVGVANLPPNMMVDENGTVSGFAIDVLRDLADLSGLDLAFQPLEPADYLAGPTETSFDIGPAFGISAERRDLMDFTYPVRNVTASIFRRADDLEDVTALSDVSGLRVGYLPDALPQTNIGSRHALIPVPFDTPKAMLNGLLDGTTDVALSGTANFQALIDRAGAGDDIVAVDPPYDQTQMAMALRIGLGGVREQLNAVIPAYVVSERYSALETRYFGTPDFWTSGRILVAWEIIGGVIVLVVGYTIWRNQRSRKQRQEQDRQKQRFEEQEAHSQELSRLVSELERSNRELDEFAYIASHDLKEPLRGIGINANFMLREDLPQKLHDRALRMGELTGRMEKQISDLLFFSRLGRGDHAETTAHASEIIATIRDELREWLDENNGEILEVGTIPALAAAPHKLKVLLQNLIVNGIIYSHAERRSVEIGFLPSVRVNDKTFCNAIFVRDNGIGIEASHRSKVFRIFSRLNKDSDFGYGTGSGLAFVRKIVEAYGGTIDYVSELGKGTTFYATLPLSRDT